MDHEALLKSVRDNARLLKVQEELDPLEEMSDDVLELMASTTCAKGFKTILKHPSTGYDEARWTLE